MSSKWRRYEVLLPVQGNDSQPIPSDWLADAILQIVDHFGAITYETQKIEGHWRHEGVLYRDDLVKIVADLPETTKNRRWMKQYKTTWKKRLKQVELWMISFKIDIE
jgi:hypothetical protein